MIKIFCDGGSRGNPGLAASAFIVVDINGKVLVKKGVFIGKTTNNVAEYTAVVGALQWLVQQNINQAVVVFHLDSQLIANQLIGTFRIKDRKLTELALKVKSLEREFTGKIVYKNIPRAQNKIADLLVNKTLDKETSGENSNSKSV